MSDLHSSEKHAMTIWSLFQQICKPQKLGKCKCAAEMHCQSYASNEKFSWSWNVNCFPAWSTCTLLDII